MILRLVHDDFKVIGEAYHDELADGEALIGSLPDNFTWVYRWNEQREAYVVHF
jgi:hypothetical protein